MKSIIILFSILFVIRLLSLFKSISNEKKLKAKGAVQYGKRNSAFLTIAHILFYFGALTEALINEISFSMITYWGIGVFAFSMIMLWLVIYYLGEVWTVKLYIAKEHKINKNFLFTYIRHPNYFLNVLPELIGIALVFEAWNILIFGLPIYLIPLIIRIQQEETIMKEKLPEFS